MNQQPYPKRLTYPPSTRKILAIIIPISSFVVLVGIGAVVFLYYKKFRSEQSRSRRPAGAIRLEDTYSSKFIQNIFENLTSFSCLVVPQEVPIDKTVSYQDEQ
jgi:hypothetical protein